MDYNFDKGGEESFSDNGHRATTSTGCQDPDFFPLMATSHHLITQQELNNLITDLNLSQTQSEWLASRLQGWNLIENVKVTSFRRLQRDFEKLLLSLEDIYCDDTEELFGALGHVHITEEWRLFIELAKVCLTFWHRSFTFNSNKSPT
jgi:hypothetical protein